MGTTIERRIVTFAVLLFSSSLFAWATQAASAETPTAAPQKAVAKPVIPDKFTNLKALPANIEKSDLMAVMKGFAISMKVRCSHCHVATDDLSSADFPSDEKATKQSARDLLRNLVEIQQKYSVLPSSSVKN
ncbi:MAG: hypothetical protein L0Z53_12735 [Acidobacteriales bacterium]|nr:hypothetical protein [Terriglobales bacterium]